MSKFAEKLRNDQDQDEEQQEYVEVEDLRAIKAILKAQLNEKVQQTPNTNIQIQNTVYVNKQIQHKKPKKEKPQFIKDDRQRQTPNHYIIHNTENIQKEEKNTRDNLKQNNQHKETKQEETQSPKIYIAKEEAIKRTEHQPQNNQKKGYIEKKKFFQKTKRGDSYENDENKNKKLQKVKYEEKTKNLEEPLQKTEKNTKPRRQVYEYKGDEIELELINHWETFDNSIYVGKKDVETYVEKAEGLLKKFDFILLRSFGIYVEKTFLVAGLLAEKYGNLKQISIPQTVDVFMINKQGEKKQSRGAINIQLSLKSLNEKHIGYQESNTISQKEKKIEYKQKRYSGNYQEKTIQKKVVYMQKKARRPRTISEEEQIQRELR